MDEAAGLNCLQYGVFGSLNRVYVLEYIGMLENVGATQISFAPTVLSEEDQSGYGIHIYGYHALRANLEFWGCVPDD